VLWPVFDLVVLGTVAHGFAASAYEKRFVRVSSAAVSASMLQRAPRASRNVAGYFGRGHVTSPYAKLPAPDACS
jgi:hypothetical protein